MDNTGVDLSRQVLKLKLCRNFPCLLFLFMSLLLSAPLLLLYKNNIALENTLINVLEEQIPDNGNIRSIFYIPSKTFQEKHLSASGKNGDTQNALYGGVATVQDGGFLVINFKTDKSSMTDNDSLLYIINDATGKILQGGNKTNMSHAQNKKGGPRNQEVLHIPLKLPDTFHIQITSGKSKKNNTYLIRTDQTSISCIYR